MGYPLSYIFGHWNQIEIKNILNDISRVEIPNLNSDPYNLNLPWL